MKDYRVKLIVHGNIVWTSDVEKYNNPKEAATWQLYWMPSNWVQRPGKIHAEVSLIEEDGREKTHNIYTTDYLDDVANITDFTEDDLKCMVAGQDIVWQLIQEDGFLVHGRIFCTREAAESYRRKNSLFNCGIAHTWVDGWYDEQDSWDRKEVKGYADLKWPTEAEI